MLVFLQRLYHLKVAKHKEMWRNGESSLYIIYRCVYTTCPEQPYRSYLRNLFKFRRLGKRTVSLAQNNFDHVFLILCCLRAFQTRDDSGGNRGMCLRFPGPYCLLSLHEFTFKRRCMQSFCIPTACSQPHATIPRTTH